MPARTYEAAPSFFLQDGGHDTTHAIPPHFGLLDSSDERWSNLDKRLKWLNETSPKDVEYKLIIAGRHGQGFHNLAEIKYGEKHWDEHWAQLDGDDEITWGPDPLLTPLGEDQAREANAVWLKELSAGAPLPDGLYSSPMTRALQTCRLTFAGVVDFADRRPIILENAREIYGLHTCDMRRTRSYLQSEFPDFIIEKGFSEEDLLHDPNVRETNDHVTERAHSVLDYIFEHDKGLVISLTAHSEFIRGLVRVTKHVPWELPTGGILPMVVKSTIVS